jgi:hypothetical protein
VKIYYGGLTSSQTSSQTCLGTCSLTTSYVGSKFYNVSVQVRLYVSFLGTQPPKLVLLSGSLSKTAPSELSGQLVDLTGSFGPWIAISPEVWTLQMMRNGSVSFPDFVFDTHDLSPWPDDLMRTRMFVAFSFGTSSGNTTDQVKVVNVSAVSPPDISEKSYYYRLDVTPEGGDVILPTGFQYPVRGHFYDLALDHTTELEGVRWVGLLASYYIPMTLLVTFVTSLVSYFARQKVALVAIVGMITGVLFGALAIFATASLQVAKYLSPWSSYVGSSLSYSIVLWVFLLPTGNALALLARGRSKNTHPEFDVKLQLDSTRAKAQSFSGGIPTGWEVSYTFFNEGVKPGRVFDSTITVVLKPPPTGVICETNSFGPNGKSDFLVYPDRPVAGRARVNIRPRVPAIAWTSEIEKRIRSKQVTVEVHIDYRIGDQAKRLPKPEHRVLEAEIPS